jgi:hypothetical protein
VNKAEDWVERKRRRPTKTSINRHLIQGVFRDNPVKKLLIPCFINDYNQNMGGIDLANQFREVYKTHKPGLRN